MQVSRKFFRCPSVGVFCCLLGLQVACSQKAQPLKKPGAPLQAGANSSGPSTASPESQDIVVCNWDDAATSAKLKKRLAGFQVSQAEAYQIAEEAYYDRARRGLFIESIDPHPLVLIGNNYLFGKAYKAKTVLKGYLVNGNTGEVHWVEIAQ